MKNTGYTSHSFNSTFLSAGPSDCVPASTQSFYTILPPPASHSLYTLLTLKLQIAHGPSPSHPLRITISLYQVSVLTCLFLVSHSPERDKKLQ